MSRISARRIAVPIALASLAPSPTAQGVPIGFEEKWALAADRSKVVDTLIPGTEEHFYYHCRERLDAGDFDTVRRVLPTWIRRHGRTARVVEIENREALLSFDRDPERTYEFLRQRLDLTFDHQRIVPGATSDLPSRLDPSLLSPTALTRQALAAFPGTVDGFHAAALPALAATNLEPNQLRSLLSRLTRPDIDNLPALIVRDLEYAQSAGFGSLPVHQLLRRPQLEECMRLRPALLGESAFVEAYLRRLQPDADTSLATDREALERHLTRLWEFAQRLPPAFNSLKAHVLYHRLQHDLTLGAPDKERFLAYIRLPRRQGYAAAAHLARHQQAADFVRVDSAFPTLLPPIGNDEALVRACLEHFFAAEDGYEAYAEFLDAEWLRLVLAETKILLGQGDMARWSALLQDPGRLEQIQQRVELRFPPTQRTLFAAGDQVRIEVDVKNVRTLLVKVFAVDSFRYQVEKQREVDASIELDGVVANFEQTHEYAEPPARRVRRAFDLPMLRDPGTYVVDFVGSGISSRAVIHKGWLSMVERTSAAGHLIRIYDEAGRHVPDASVWFGGRDYAASTNGEILVPFTTDPGSRKVVLHTGERSALATLNHRAESYSLRAPTFVNREGLVAGQRSRLIVRPVLQLSGHQVSLQLLQEPVLLVTATDIDGLSTTQELRQLALQDQREFVHEFTVPERLASLSVALRGKVVDIAGSEVPLATAPAVFPVNGIDTTALTGSVLLMRTSTGYVVELRGKNGEPQRGRSCQVRLRHRDYRQPIQVALQSDAGGRIELGPLPGIEAVSIQKGQDRPIEFAVTEARCRWPAALHGRSDQVLRLPYQGRAAAPSRAEFSLLGVERDAFEHLAIADGFLELRRLPPGDYELHLHRTGEILPVRITRGERDGSWLIGTARTLQATVVPPLHLRQIERDDQELRVRLANATAATRVHVFATRYTPAFDPFTLLAAEPVRSPAFAQLDRPWSSYHAGRRLGDEYRYVLERRYAQKHPGNMLRRPSLLLSPWVLEQDSWNAAVGLGRGPGDSVPQRSGGRVRRDQNGKESAREGGGHGQDLTANLDFLPRGSALLANLVPDAQGIARVALTDLGDGQEIHVVAIDGDQVVYDTVTGPERRLEPRPRTLPRALDPSRHFAEQKRIEFLAAGGTAVLADARSAQVEIYDSLASVHRLFTTISKEPALARFVFLLQWPELSADEKRKHYTDHACHELNFFLHQKDPEFFAAIVRPFLAAKFEKTFLDHWLLGETLDRYLEPWQFAQLNLIERILLARRLGDDRRAAIARTVRESLELQPVDPAHLGRLFQLALRADEMNEKAGLRLLDAAGDTSLDAQEPRAAERAAATPPQGPATGGRARAKAETGLEAAEAADADSIPALQAQEVQLRRNVQQLYRPVKPTRIHVETNYWQRRLRDNTADIVAPNNFWADYAAAPLDQPFASAALVEATNSFLEMMFALAVLDLPFSSGGHEIIAEGAQRTVKARTPLLLVRKEVAAVEPGADPAPLLLGQNLFRLDDRYRYVNGQRRDAFVTEEFIVDVAYGCQVVVTNPTSQPRDIEVLLQIPAGAVPLLSGFWTRGVPLQLQPYATTTVEYAFYFPAAGDFTHYPTQATEQNRLVAAAEARELRVVVDPSRIDKTSWDHVSQNGSAAEVLDFLVANNVQRLDLDKVAWRARDRDFHRSLLNQLRQRHCYHGTLWSYAILHRDPVATGEFLRHRDEFLAQCGTWLESTLVRIDPRERRSFEQLELEPLVHPRAHQLGGQRLIGNADLAGQYRALLDLIGYRPRLDHDDWLAVTYYLLLQDRIEEALETSRSIDPAGIAAGLQHDYMSAYLCFYTGDLSTARRLAEAHRDHPVTSWRQRFRDVLAQLDEAEGKVPPVDERGPDQSAATAPALELALDGRNVVITHHNLSQCEVRYYEVDVEFAFSARPFAGPDGSSAAFVQPNRREVRDLPAGQGTLAFELPQPFWQRNVLVEVRAAGLVRSRQYFANALDVRFLESHGQIVVAEPESQRPIAKTYVKVFARLPGGKVQFHKDGYTDLRGRFDYASLSDDPNLGADRYAVLVLDEARGAVIRELPPPAR